MMSQERLLWDRLSRNLALRANPLTRRITDAVPMTDFSGAMLYTGQVTIVDSYPELAAPP